MPSKFSRYPLSLIAVLLSVAGCAQSEAPGDLDPECTKKADCSSTQKCVDQKCVPDPCYDGLLSVGETDVDCGGVCDACGLDQHCEKPGDCIFGECENHVCVDPNRPCRTPKRGEIIFSEILNNIQKDVNFDNLSSSQNEFFEIYNTTAFKLGLENVTLICTDLNDEDATPIQIALEGCMDAHAAAVLSVSSISVPQDVLNVTIIPSSNFLPPTGSYECRLVNVSDQTISTAYLRGGYEAGISETTELLDYNADGMIFEAHDKLSDFRHTPGLCTNGARFSDNCDTHCNDGQKNHEETDVDCGGPLCQPCRLTKGCQGDDDCESHLCQSGVCVTPPKTCRELGCDKGFCDEVSGKCYSCDDGDQNGDEIDVDCGGSYCLACEPNQFCNEDDDCLSESCVNHICANKSNLTVIPPDKGELLISEFFNVPSASRAMSVWQNGVSQAQEEFIEIVNTSNFIYNLEGVTLSVNNMSTGETLAEWPLYGSLAGHRALVLSHTKLNGLPPHTRNLTLLSSDNLFDDEANIQLTLKYGATTLHQVGADTPISGISDVLNPFEYSGNTRTLTKHNVANPALLHSPGYCTNGALFANDCDTLCNNHHLDGDETDVDCGGPLCPACDVGKTCNNSHDCDSRQCVGNKCQEKPCTEVGCSDDAWCNASTGKCESCNDNTKNGTETDVDCGGSRCGGCEKGKTCSTNDDCLSHTCSYGRCTGDPCITPSPSSLIITEVMGAPNADLAFGTSSTNQMEFIEFVNKTSSRIDLSDVTLSWLKDGSTSPDTIAFSGCIEPKSAIVVSSAAIADLPSEVTNVTSMKNDTMTNSSLYHVRLDNLDTRIDEVTRQGTSTGTRGISQTRDPQLSTSATSLVLSNTVSTFSNTPGYCSNGGSYTQSCLDPCKDNQKTWNETDVDCGGDMCAKCTKGKACRENTDCESNVCTSNRCVGDPCYTPVAGELLITEVMGSPKSGGKFEFLTTTEQVEFIEIANASNRRLNLAEVTLNYQKGTDTTKTVALTGCIDPKNAVLVTSKTKPLTGLPTGVSNQSILSSATAITNNVAYQIWLETTGTDAVKLDEVTRAANSTTGISQSRNPTLDKTATLQLSNTVSDYANSPGYCSNGKEFIKECR